MKRDSLFGQEPKPSQSGAPLEGVNGGLSFGKMPGMGERRNKRPNAMPAGGGGGAWAMEQRKMNESRKAKAFSTKGVRGQGSMIDQQFDTRATKTAEWAREKIAAGDIEGGMAANLSGTSIFDPVLTELCYRWFCPPGGVILDPFAGGSVRGIVAAKLGRDYVGLDLSARQIAANEAQARAILDGDEPAPVWIPGDSLDIDKLARPWLFETGKASGADFLFSCPPYGDLEVYSEDPRDLSSMGWDEFRDTYREIIARSVDLLAMDRFAAFVVGDFRDKDGFYRGFPWETVRAFQEAGLKLYNEAVLVTAAGSLPLRTRKQFEVSRKLGKTHQNLLVFCKGDPRKAAAAVGPVEFYAGEESEPSNEGEKTDMAPVEPHSPPATSEHDGILVVRDDLFPGGTKARFLPLLFSDEVDEIVYASPAEGGAQTALAWAAKARGKRATIFVAARKEPHPRGILARQLGANVIEVKPGYLAVVQARAREYAAQAPDRALVPFGADVSEALTVIAGAARSLNIEPAEVWCAAGSGVLARGLALAWPNARRHVVQVGRELSRDEVAGAEIHVYPKPFSAEGSPAPFPSDPHYDAKAWEVTKARHGPGLCVFWNVTGAAIPLDSLSPQEP